MDLDRLLDKGTRTQQPAETQTGERVALAQGVGHDRMRIAPRELGRIVDEDLLAVDLVVNQPDSFARAPLEGSDEAFRRRS